MNFTDAERALLINVEELVKQNPHLTPHIIMQCNAGIDEKLAKSQAMASDMECALGYVIYSNKKKDVNEFVKEKISKWRNKSFLNWDWFFERDKDV